MGFPRYPPLHVELAFGADIDPVDWTGYTYTDVSDRVRGGYTERGRNNDLTALEAGRGLVTLDNRDGELTPGNASGSYFPDVEPMTPIRITSNTSAYRAIHHAPRHFWPLTEQSGLFADHGSNPVLMTAYVNTGAGNSITPRGGALPCPAEGDEKALDFVDGGSSYSRIRTGAGDSGAAGTPVTDVDLAGNLNFSCWIDLDGSITHPAAQYIASHRYPTPELWYLFIQTDGDLQFVAWDTTGATHSLTYAAGLEASTTPAHIAINYDNSADHLEMYINGTEVAEDAAFFGAATPRTATNSQLGIGQNGNTGGRFEGRIAYVFYDDIDLSASDIGRLCRAGQTTTEDHVTDPLSFAQPASVAHMFVERWVPRWPGQDTDAVIDLELVDQSKLPVMAKPAGFYPYEVRADSATHHWRLEGAGEKQDWVTGQADLIDDTGNPPDNVDDSPIYDTSASINCDQSVNEEYNGSGLSPTGASQAASWECWFQKSGAPSTAVFPLCAGTYGTGDCCIYIATDGHVYAAVAGTTASPMDSGSSEADGSWHHAVVTFDGTNAWELYVDGFTQDTKTDAHTLATSTIQIGDDPLAGSNSVTVAEVAVYDTELDPDRIEAHYNCATGHNADTPGQRVERFADYFRVPATHKQFASSTLNEPDSGLMVVGALEAGQSMMEVIDGVVTPIFGNFYVGRNGTWTWHHPLDRPSWPVQSTLTLWARRHISMWRGTALDESLYRGTVTLGGNPAKNAQASGFKYIPQVATSWYFDGANDEAITNLTDVGADATWFMYGWFRPDDAGSGDDMLMGVFTSGGANKFQVYYDHTNELFQYESPSSSTTLPGQSVGDSPAGEWYMITVVHSGNGANETEWWLQGTSMGTFTASATLANNDRFRVGEEGGGGNDYTGDAHDCAFGAFFLPNDQWVTGLNRLRSPSLIFLDDENVMDFVPSYDDYRRYTGWQTPQAITWFDHETDRQRYSERVYNISDATQYAEIAGGFSAGALLGNVVGKLKHVGPRIGRVVFDLAAGNGTKGWHACTLEIDMRIAFELTGPDGNPLDWSGWIDSVRHDFSPHSGHQVTITLSP